MDEFKSLMYADLIISKASSRKIICFSFKKLRHSLDDFPMLNTSMAFSSIFFIFKFLFILSLKSIILFVLLNKVVFSSKVFSVSFIFKFKLFFSNFFSNFIPLFDKERLISWILFIKCFFSFLSFLSFFSTSAFKLNTNLLRKSSVLLISSFSCKGLSVF